jgi:hypothetical protein
VEAAEMSSAYGHAIAPMGGLDTGKAFGHVYNEASQVPHWNDKSRLPNCTGRNCEERPVFITRYLYVTGRAGRVTDRIQYCCKSHGEAFAKKHGLELPA